MVEYVYRVVETLSGKWFVRIVDEDVDQIINQKFLK